MQDIIASYLIQSKECHLPLLGNFMIVKVPALLDVANKKLVPSSNEIVFAENSDFLSEGVIDYVAHLDYLSLRDAEEKINNWCLHAKVKLDAGEKIDFDFVGGLQKDADGNICFYRRKCRSFYEPVVAERVIHKNAEHAVLVGDKETTSGAMNKFYSDEGVIERKSSWKMWSIGLLAVSLLVLFFYFYSHTFSESAIANQSGIPVRQPAVTYFMLK